MRYQSGRSFRYPQVCGGREMWPKNWFGFDPEKFFEEFRDVAAILVVVLFLSGLLAAYCFFVNLR
jgi:hypothetical protein